MTTQGERGGGARLLGVLDRRPPHLLRGRRGRRGRLVHGSCCCGLAVDPKTTAAEYAAYAEELRGLAWSQPAGPNPQPEGSG
jgi:hypothetical protein